MKPLGFVDPRSPSAMTVEEAENDRRMDGLVVIRRMGRGSRGSVDCMVESVESGLCRSAEKPALDELFTKLHAAVLEIRLKRQCLVGNSLDSERRSMGILLVK